MTDAVSETTAPDRTAATTAAAAAATGAAGPRPRSPAATLGLIACRILVPLWIGTGATFKLLEATPGLLPKQILTDADRLGLDLGVLLAALIGLEYLAAAVIFFVGRLARPAAIFMMSVFCLVLLREIAAGNTSCGCLGSASPSPWVMLAIDGALLLAVIGLKPAPLAPLDAARWPAAAALVLAGAGAGTSFAKIVGHGDRAAPAPVGPPPAAGARATSPGPAAEPAPAGPLVLAPPGDYWFESNFEGWIGRSWKDIPLIQFMEKKPRDLDAPRRYVVFYSRTCDHCEAMFEEDLAPNPALAAEVTAVEVPAEKDRLRGEGSWPMPETRCELLELPLGPDWIIQTPLTLRLEHGIVRCATEGDHRKCMGLE